MTYELVQNRLQQYRKFGHGYREITRGNDGGFYPDHESGPADVALNVLVGAINRKGLTQRVKNGKTLDVLDDDPSTCFRVPPWNIKSLVKSMAVCAIEEFGLAKVGYIDVNDAVRTPERAQNTATYIDSLSRTSAQLGGITFIAVEAGENLSPSELSNVGQIYESLSNLPPENYRVAVLSKSDIYNQVAQA